MFEVPGEHAALLSGLPAWELQAGQSDGKPKWARTKDGARQELYGDVGPSWIVKSGGSLKLYAYKHGGALPHAYAGPWKDYTRGTFPNNPEIPGVKVSAVIGDLSLIHI